ncbi:MAG: PfkB family carbohydrate kinase [Limnochordia bacterium]|jgi:2-dehydro-3-deoxygluconokinase|nr:sugar kinase [Bacillota bacterium]
MTKKVVTLGEIMLRLSTPNYQRFVQAESFDVVYGGGEANVAVSLANYGLDSYYVTKLPTNPLGQSALNYLRRFGVKTDHIVRGEGRLGIYFLETGAAMRPSKVVYDRADSTIANAKASDFDFEKIFTGADWFHFTGITPALNRNAAQLTEEALKTAKSLGVTVSVDLNYRKNLWTPEEAQKTMTHLMQYVDVCIGNEEDAEKTLGFKPGKTDVAAGSLELAGYRDIFVQMREKFGFKLIATSLRESYSASDNGWSALIYDGQEFYHSKKYDVRIVDRVGGGDSFSAGLIYGLLEGMSPQDALEFSVAASALKHTIHGDFNHVSVDEVLQLVQGDASGRVQR